METAVGVTMCVPVPVGQTIVQASVLEPVKLRALAAVKNPVVLTAPICVPGALAPVVEVVLRVPGAVIPVLEAVVVPVENRAPTAAVLHAPEAVVLSVPAAVHPVENPADLLALLTVYHRAHQTVHRPVKAVEGARLPVVLTAVPPVEIRVPPPVLGNLLPLLLLNIYQLSMCKLCVINTL